MKKWRKIKNNFKSNGLWTDYKAKFEHKQMRFVVTKIALVVNPNIDVKTLESIEKILLKSKKNENMYFEAFVLFKKEVNYSADWESFGKFMWYVFQTSTYYKDVKKDVENIYKKGKINETNKKRRIYYQKWIHSMDKKDLLFNEKIIKIMKLVF